MGTRTYTVVHKDYQALDWRAAMALLDAELADGTLTGYTVESFAWSESGDAGRDVRPLTLRVWFR